MQKGLVTPEKCIVLYCIVCIVTEATILIPCNLFPHISAIPIFTVLTFQLTPIPTTLHKVQA